MKKFNVIMNIISLPTSILEGNASIYSLLKQSGYFELHSQINETDIFEVLIQHLEYIKQWQSLSEDKRSSSGWYFKQKNTGMYVVGYFPPKENLRPTEYFDEVEACAAFIKREIEDIRNS